MKACQPKVQTEVVAEGRGSGVTVCVSQDDQDPGGWVIEVYAQFTDNDSSRMFIGSFTVQAPNATTRRAARAAYTVAVPGAFQYTLLVRAPLRTATQPDKPLMVGCFCGDVSPYLSTPLNP